MIHVNADKACLLKHNAKYFYINLKFFVIIFSVTNEIAGTYL